MQNIDYNEFSNYEIEIKLKELEFQYEKTANDIREKTKELDYLNNNYIKGKEFLDKRLYPNKYK